MSTFMWCIVLIVVYLVGAVVACRVTMALMNETKAWDDVSGEDKGWTIAFTFLWPVAVVVVGLCAVVWGLYLALEFFFLQVVLPLAGVRPSLERQSKTSKRKLEKIERELQKKT